jgi:fibronectin type 3 domain-containing protein
MWNASTAGDFDYYEISSRPSGSSTWTVLATPRVTSLTVTNLVNGVTYEFSVTSVDMAGNKSARSTVSVTPAPPV